MNCFPLIDTRPQCQSVADFLYTTDLLVDNVEDADVFLVAGWDGWMLDMMRKWHHHKKPFLGINCGTRGFLLNTFDESYFSDLSEESFEYVQASLVDVTLTTKDGDISEGFFINDLVLWASVLDYFRFTIQVGEKGIQTEWTGLVVSTMLWSTGYAANLGQPLIGLDEHVWGISGIATAPFQYDFFSPQPITIYTRWRKPLTVWLDGYNGKYEHIEKIEIKPSERSVELVFFKEEQFAEKRRKLAEEKTWL